jgi:hypothetical protein
MSRRTVLSGHFTRNNAAFLNKRAENKIDPRHIFYQAMLDHQTYERYLEHVGALKVDVPTYRAGPISGRQEILYARHRGWIVDD